MSTTNAVDTGVRPTQYPQDPGCGRCAWLPIECLLQAVPTHQPSPQGPDVAAKILETAGFAAECSLLH